MSEPLSGRVVVVTRQHPGALADRLSALGARVIHIPLIAVTDPPDGRARLGAALADLDSYSWLVVTSPNGARRITAVPGPATRIAAVGRGTDRALVGAIGRSADLVPAVQRLDGLLAEFPRGTGRVLAARGDRADPALVSGLESLGWRVDDVVAYHTVNRVPGDDERDRVTDADVVVFASGSAVSAWVAAFGADTALSVVTIGPSTSAVAARKGLPVAAEAAQQSIDGIVDAVVALYR